MRIQIGLTIMTMCALLASSAFADTVEQSQSQSTTSGHNDRIGVTNLAVRPSAGAIIFNGNQRFAGGVLLDFNLLSTSLVKVGPAFGAIFSGLNNGSFFGSVPQSTSNYIIQIPANLKATIAPDPARRLQLGAHGGANVIYSSSGAAGGGVGFGSSPTANLGTTSGGASWDVHPNVGGDVDYALGTNVDLSLRPDVTFLSAFNMLTATLGLAVKL